MEWFSGFQAPGWDVELSYFSGSYRVAVEFRGRTGGGLFNASWSSSAKSAIAV